MSNLMLDSIVDLSNLTSLLSRCKALNCSMSSIDLSAASQFTSMLLNSQSSYLESVVEMKLKSNDSLMRAVMMMQFFEIRRCLNARFVSELVTNSMFCNSSTEIKNSSFDSNSIKSALVKSVDETAEVLAEMMLIENSSKY